METASYMIYLGSTYIARFIYEEDAYTFIDALPKCRAQFMRVVYDLLVDPNQTESL